MKRSHALAFALVLGATLTLALGTGSFTTTEAARDVTIETSDSPYLGLSSGSPTADANGSSTVDLLTVTNGFETELSSVSVTTTHGDVSGVDHAERIAVGEETTVRADVTCGSAGTVDVDLSVSVAGDGVSVETTETVTVDCVAGETATAQNG